MCLGAAPFCCRAMTQNGGNFTKYFAQNFKRLGIKKLISTSYAADSKKYSSYQPTLFEVNEPHFDKSKTRSNGKIFTLTEDTTGDGKVDIEDLQWTYLKGDGDFRSPEIMQGLRDEADIVITNPPFSLFREFLAWIVEADKKFLIIGNMNAITYKEVFPLIQHDSVWLGPSITSGDREFEVPQDIVDLSKFTGEIRHGRYYQRVMGVRWFTNLEQRAPPCANSTDDPSRCNQIQHQKAI